MRHPRITRTRASRQRAGRDIEVSRGLAQSCAALGEPAAVGANARLLQQRIGDFGGGRIVSARTRASARSLSTTMPSTIWRDNPNTCTALLARIEFRPTLPSDS